MSESAATRGWDAIRRAELVGALGDLFRRRAVMAPVAIVILTLLFWYEPATWRRVLILAVVPIMLTVVIGEVVRSRRGTLGPAAATGNAIAMLIGFGAIGFATGGIESPMMPAVFVIVLLGSLLASLGAARWIGLATAALVLMFATMQTLDVIPGLMPEALGGRAHHPVPLMAALRGLALTLMIVAIYLVATRVRVAFERMGDRAGAASQAALDGLADESRTLGLLTAEIAHELKNPLSSVKGLAGLVAKDLDGKPAERMAVLRREVDRMQEILEQFLTLSRPVVPLEVAPLDPRALCDDIAALHEGVAVEQGVRIEVRGPRHLALAGDVRKLGQVLTNLVQNALAVSPRGSAIVLEVAAADPDVLLRVLDVGPGLPADLAGRAFEPGVTSKPDGSGLGLAIARSLARQHGGDIELAARDGGGLAACVRVPRGGGS